MKPHFKLQAVEVANTPDGGALLLTYADGVKYTVNIAPIIAKAPSLRALAKPAVFRRAKLGEFGRCVTWGDDELELAGDNLRAEAIEQAGGISHEFVLEWMHRNGLTIEAAAAALGLSVRMLAYYRSGEKPVPRTVALACRGWEAIKASRAAGDDRFVLAA
ncbi:hypothetical protein C8245_13905 [Paracidovorax avenae]|uniref:DUF2442 domain-containing protein n=1 Tax=Paracidovorax avenae TaxID=80867 RepID=UPI000D2136B2|nr:DUF2442 domain-containing protein [Paracidovorax avenae]AVS66629.1 hypothetical protein C8245_13905 [Paracidovorax avenae]